MIEIVSSFAPNAEKTTILETANKAIETIKNELPEEAQTLEVMKCIISEIQNVVNESRIFL